jgi:hypothetical protein
VKGGKPGRDLRGVERRKAELAALAAAQRAQLGRRVEGLSGALRWADRGWALARALRTGVSWWGALRCARAAVTR